MNCSSISLSIFVSCLIIDTSLFGMEQKSTTGLVGNSIIGFIKKNSQTYDVTIEGILKANTFHRLYPSEEKKTEVIEQALDLAVNRQNTDHKRRERRIEDLLGAAIKYKLPLNPVKLSQLETIINTWHEDSKKQQNNLLIIRSYSSKKSSNPVKNNQTYLELLKNLNLEKFDQKYPSIEDQTNVLNLGLNEASKAFASSIQALINLKAIFSMANKNSLSLSLNEFSNTTNQINQFTSEIETLNKLRNENIAIQQKRLKLLRSSKQEEQQDESDCESGSENEEDQSDDESDDD